MKIIHQIIGKKPSEIVKTCLESWKNLEHFDFEIIYWNDEKIENFVKEYYPFAYQPILTARNHAEVADIARYLIVYHFGGFYVDWDILLNDIQGFINLSESESQGYLLIDPINGTFASEHFSAAVNEGYLLRIVEQIVQTYTRNERELMYTPQYSGPYRMKNVLQNFPHTTQKIIPVKEVFEFDYKEVRDAEVFGENGIMTHFWEHSWIKTLE